LSSLGSDDGLIWLPRLASSGWHAVPSNSTQDRFREAVLGFA